MVGGGRWERSVVIHPSQITITIMMGGKTFYANRAVGLNVKKCRSPRYKAQVLPPPGQKSQKHARHELQNKGGMITAYGSANNSNNVSIDRTRGSAASNRIALKHQFLRPELLVGEPHLTPTRIKCGKTSRQVASKVKGTNVTM